MSTIPPNNLSAVYLTPAKNCRLFGYFPVTRIYDTGDKFFPGVFDTAEQFIDTGDKYSFPKKFKTAPMEHLGAWGTLIHEKNLKLKILCQTPFNVELYYSNNSNPATIFPFPPLPCKM